MNQPADYCIKGRIERREEKPPEIVLFKRRRNYGFKKLQNPDCRLNKTYPNVV